TSWRYHTPSRVRKEHREESCKYGYKSTGFSGTIATDNMDKFCQAICAFSNDISGSGKNGYLIIGVHDNGKLSGLKVDDKLLLKISNIRTDGNILPQPVMTVEKFSFDDGDVLVTEVQPSEFPPFVIGDVFGCGLVQEKVLLQKRKKKY
ncbi:Putative DNA-binding domain-containing protein, partial [Porphyromonadaceae bacterium KHP3R9]